MDKYYILFVSMFVVPLSAASSSSEPLKQVPSARCYFSFCSTPTGSLTATSDIAYQPIPDSAPSHASVQAHAIINRILVVCEAFPEHGKRLATLDAREQLLFREYFLGKNQRRALLRRAAYARLNRKHWPEEYLRAIDALIELSEKI